MGIDELLASLEDYLVREFRALQSLVAISKEERDILVEGKTDALLRITEEKEFILDQIGLVEDARRNVSQRISQLTGLKNENTTLVEIFPVVDVDVRTRLKNLYDGIIVLVDQTRSINVGNRALATAHADCLDATQAYLLKMIMPPTGYQNPAAPIKNLPPVWGVEHKA